MHAFWKIVEWITDKLKVIGAICLVGMTFLLSVFFFGEIFTQGHAVAFACIWTALALVSAETALRSRRLAEARK